MAVSSGARGLEALVVAGTHPSEEDLDILRDVSDPGVAVWSVDPQGGVREVSRL